MIERGLIIEHAVFGGKIERSCTRCGLHVDANGEIDQDFYTARMYFKLMAIPVDQRCSHKRAASVPLSNKELSIAAENVHTLADLRVILMKVIQKLPE